MRFHIQNAKREQEAYLGAVEQARVSRAIDAKAAARAERKRERGEDADDDGSANKKKKKAQRPEREHWQREGVRADGGNAAGKKALEGVLGRLF